MTSVLGKDVNLYMYRDISGTPTPVLMACGTSVSKEEVSEEIEVRQNTARERSYVGGAKDATISVEGLITLDELPRWQYADFVDSVGNVERVLLRYENALGDVYTYDCQALITSVSDQAGATDFATFSVTLRRSGAATITLVIDALRDSNGELILDSDGYPIR